VGIALSFGGHSKVAIPPFIAIAPAALMLAALVPLYISRPRSDVSIASQHAYQ
jgi:hypothetical protein